jgi:SAM-dependent methyltransferase
VTLIEPNREQIGSFALEGVEIIPRTFEDFTSEERYDLVLCSHVLYHVPLEAWESFIDKLLSHVRPGGTCLIVLAADRGEQYEMMRDFILLPRVGRRVIEILSRKGIAFEVFGKANCFIAESFEDMHTLCRFFVLEDCYTQERLAALSESEARELGEKIRRCAERCRTADGTYRLEEEEDMILIQRAAAGIGAGSSSSR